MGRGVRCGFFGFAVGVGGPDGDDDGDKDLGEREVRGYLVCSWDAIDWEIGWNEMEWYGWFGWSF